MFTRKHQCLDGITEAHPGGIYSRPEAQTSGRIDGPQSHKVVGRQGTDDVTVGCCLETPVINDSPTVQVQLK